MADKQTDGRPAWAVRAEELAQARRRAEGRDSSRREGFWVFLVAAFLSGAGTVIVLLNQEAFYDKGDAGAWAFLILLAVTVLGALFFLLCFRVTKIGARMLNMTPLMDDRPVVEHIGFGFETESGASEKRQASARLKARAARRAALRQSRQARKASPPAQPGADE